MKQKPALKSKHEVLQLLKNIHMEAQQKYLQLQMKSFLYLIAAAIAFPQQSTTVEPDSIEKYVSNSAESSSEGLEGKSDKAYFGFGPWAYNNMLLGGGFNNLFGARNGFGMMNPYAGIPYSTLGFNRLNNFW